MTSVMRPGARPVAHVLSLDPLSDVHSGSEEELPRDDELYDGFKGFLPIDRRRLGAEGHTQAGADSPELGDMAVKILGHLTLNYRPRRLVIFRHDSSPFFRPGVEDEGNRVPVKLADLTRSSRFSTD